MTDQEMRDGLRAKIAEQDVKRGRPLTDMERLENLAERMVQDSIEEAARTICHDLGRWCHGQHPCDPCPEHCGSWRQYQSAAAAALNAAHETNFNG